VAAALVAVEAATGAVVHARLFRFADALRERSSGAVESLVHESKLRVLILTGDHAASAQSVGEEVCLAPADVRSGMLPEDKMRVVGELRAEATAANLRPGVVRRPSHLKTLRTHSRHE
jgi:Cu+-exporting ATPase